MLGRAVLTMKYKVISLFSGAMGLDLGLEQTGRFEIVACVEKEPAFCETIRQNQREGRLPKSLKVFEGDIASISPQQVLDECGLAAEEVDLIVGGPPCQAFSTAGKRGTVQDPRGTLLWEYLRFVNAIRPRFFLMENVRGLLSAALKHRPIAQRPDKGGPPLTPEEEPGSVVRLFAKDLEELPGAPYHLDVFEVNSVNYGAPQIRERVLFIGNRDGRVVDFPPPTHGAPEPEDPSELPGLSEAHKPWTTLGEAIGGLPPQTANILDFSPRKKSFLELVPAGSNWRSLPIDLQKESMGKAWYAKGGRSGWWRRLSFDLPSPTLVTMPNHASTALCHPTETRALSIEEYARIQEFPPGWKFCGRLAEQYAQVGNAVPTRLGSVAGKILSQALDRPPPAKPDDAVAAGPRIIYVQSHVRTRRWFKDGQPIIWEDGNEDRSAGYSRPKTTKKIRSLQSA